MSAPADSNGLATQTTCYECADEPVATHQCSICKAMCKVFDTPCSSVALVCLVFDLTLIWSDLAQFCLFLSFECLVANSDYQIISILNHSLDSIFACCLPAGVPHAA